MPVPAGGLTIGRDLENDLALEDSMVSRRHARLSYAHGRLWIEDCESANGTLVDGKPVDRRAVKAPREELFARLLRPLLGAMDAERAFLFKSNTRHGTVRMVFTHLAAGADPEQPVSESAALAVAREREPVLITDLIGERGRELRSVDRLSLARVRSVMIAPLLLGRKLVGVLYLDSASSRRRFLSKDLALLARAATCLAGLLDSVQVTEELVEENDRLRTMVTEAASGEVPL